MIEQHQNDIDFTKVPESKGLSRGTLMIALSGVIVIFLIGGFCAFLSGYGHMWPSINTTRMPLGHMPSQNP